MEHVLEVRGSDAGKSQEATKEWQVHADSRPLILEIKYLNAITRFKATNPDFPPSYVVGLSGDQGRPHSLD